MMHVCVLYLSIGSVWFHLYTLTVKLTLILLHTVHTGHAFFEGHKAILRGNDGHGLHGLLEIPALDMRLLCFDLDSMAVVLKL